MINHSVNHHRFFQPNLYCVSQISLGLVLALALQQSPVYATPLAASIAEKQASASNHNARKKSITLQRGSLSIGVQPQTGGRITSLRLLDRELLTPDSGDSSTGFNPDNNNYGSTFWLSPQSLWNWPPVSQHDSAQYQITEQTEFSLRMRSQSAAGAQISKQVSLAENGLARMDYQITAEKDFTEVAAWEITRVPTNTAGIGFAFAPVNRHTVKTVHGRVPFQLDGSDVLWLPLENNAPLMEGKLIANGSEGWLAYVAGGILYVKIYPQISAAQMATGEGDIELYLSGKKPYLELEVQSAAHALPKGESLHWSVEWLTLPVPEQLEVRAGSAALLEFVRQQVTQLRQLPTHVGSAANLSKTPGT